MLRLRRETDELGHTTDVDREPLENGIAQVLADNLAPELGSERITVVPWREGVARVLDYQVAVMVLRFEGLLGRGVVLTRRGRRPRADGRDRRRR
jgi:hypothetical protein